jgi:hypothetical protein
VGNANLGECPAGGLHSHAGNRNYCLPLGGSVHPVVKTSGAGATNARLSLSEEARHLANAL